MLKLSGITKDYTIGDMQVHALRGIDIEFRENEFVSILGPSGCGKTTLLNIIGGLDRYTSGDLIINGTPTKLYTDRDWDTYRNHSIGFVFQSYNLIPHQSVLSNVELALTLSGVSKAERRKRATEALEKVGLGDQLNKKPNQMSGGQMQRVAIARALVNNPDILLADEPTGALDSETSVQIMELLKEIAKDKLVIMVTHNPEIAEEYSTRIIRLLDGRVISDSEPYTYEEEKKEEKNKATKKPSMSFFTALSLSLNNLLTKKTRTFLTSFAGSIGIIGIALILSLSNGVNAYIQRVEEETLSSYPLTIEQATMDMTSMADDLMGKTDKETDINAGKIYSNNIMTELMSTMVNGISINNLEAFKTHLDNSKDFKEHASAIEYLYSTPLNIFSESGTQIHPDQIFNTLVSSLGMGEINTNSQMMSMNPMMQNAEIWKQLLDNDELIEKQYELVVGSFPKKYNEVVIVVNRKNQISDFTLYSLGLKDRDELEEMMLKAQKGEKIEATAETEYTYEEILDLKFKLMVNTDYFSKNKNGTWTDRTEDKIFVQSQLKDCETIKVVGIIKPSEDAINKNTSGFVGYRKELMETLINKVNASDIVNEQKANPEINIFTGAPFKTDYENVTYADIMPLIESMPEDQQPEVTAFLQSLHQQGLSEEEITASFVNTILKSSSAASYENNLTLMGVADLNKPAKINIYPKDFEAKESITKLIDDYNDATDEANGIKYTDYIGLMMSSVTTIINAITYILIAFVSISLIVSSIMIGIITYISVLERTKEIGILRAMGASKRDVSRVFNAETLIVGFVAGALGILVTILLLIPINAIISAITSINGLALLPTAGALILVAISMFLTFIAGLIPSRIAAKKDPVTALRTE